MKRGFEAGRAAALDCLAIIEMHVPGVERQALAVAALDAFGYAVETAHRAGVPIAALQRVVEMAAGIEAAVTGADNGGGN